MQFCIWDKSTTTITEIQLLYKKAQLFTRLKTCMWENHILVPEENLSKVLNSMVDSGTEIANFHPNAGISILVCLNMVTLREEEINNFSSLV